MSAILTIFIKQLKLITFSIKNRMVEIYLRMYFKSIKLIPGDSERNLIKFFTFKHVVTEGRGFTW